MRRERLPNVPLKYQINGLCKIIKKNFNAKIVPKSETVYVNLLDAEDFPIYVNGRIKFEKGDLEGRKRGVFMLVDVSASETFTPIEQVPVIALGEQEGHHLVILISRDGNVFTKNKDYWKEWFLAIGMSGNCTIRSMEIKKSDLIRFSGKNVEEAAAIEKRIAEANETIKEATQRKRIAQTKRTKLMKQDPNSELLVEYDNEINKCQSKIDTLTIDIKEFEAQMEKLEVPDIISSDESDAEEFEEQLAKKRKKIPLTQEQLENAKKLKLGKKDPKKDVEELSLEESDYDDDEDDSYSSSESSEEEDSDEEEEEEFDGTDEIIEISE
jgi:hypothetical protein